MAPPGRLHRQGRLKCLSQLENCFGIGATLRDFCKLRAVWEKAGNGKAKDRIERAECIHNRHNILKKLCLKSYRMILLTDFFVQPEPVETASYLTKFQST
jgi:hypothetical protein